ncbi:MULTISPECIES: chemotaxis protein CheD [unclassified Sphingomonas]|uniref:chemotaxis protein CheD n=1 Tax=unclassified Sphingomonas TaxID=196159 RepID=UPI00226AD253|nr:MULTISPECIES: chemotaxis protein CheD [unclassified Sphingomonas]
MNAFGSRIATPPRCTPIVRADGFCRTSIIQGERGVSADPQVLFSTVLGSCIAACLFDPEAKVGGINHFLLGEPQPGQIIDAAAQHRYGVHAMELLINDMLRHGARRSRLRAHLYGGANLNAGMRAIGTDNAAFAVRFLQQDGIPLLVQDLGGRSARRVEFLAAQGRSRVKVVRDAAVAVPPRYVSTPAVTNSGELDLF